MTNATAAQYTGSTIPAVSTEVNKQIESRTQTAESMVNKESPVNIAEPAALVLYGNDRNPITRIETSLSHRSNNYKSGLQALKTVNKMYNDGSINRETYEFNLGIIESWSKTAPMFIEDLNKLRKRIESMNEQE